MKRKVFLKGELGEQFGTEFSVIGDTFAKCLACVQANRPNLKNYLINASESGTDYRVLVEDKELTEDDLTEPSLGDITIIPVPAGSKSAGSKIVASLALLALLVVNPGFMFYGLQNATGAVGGASSFLTAKGMFVASLATNLALTGIQQLMMPDPATDSDQPESYLFNGSQQNAVEGDPVPLLYGELRVPGTPVSFEIVNREFPRNNVTLDGDGNLILVGV